MGWLNHWNQILGVDEKEVLGCDYGTMICLKKKLHCLRKLGGTPRSGMMIITDFGYKRIFLLISVTCFTSIWKGQQVKPRE